MKGLPLTYNRDLQEDKEPIFDSAATLSGLSGGHDGGDRHAARRRRCACAKPPSDPLLLATDLAEALVREGVPFREAHEAVGQVVAHCVEKDLDLRSLSREDLRAFHGAFPLPAGELLSLDRALEERSLVGGTARVTVSAALDAAQRQIGDALDALDALNELEPAS